MSKIFQFFKNFNIFGGSILFYVNSSQKAFSNTGSFLTIIIFFVLTFIFCTSDMVNHQNPKTSDQIISSTHSEILLDNKNYAPVLMMAEFIFLNNTQVYQNMVEIDPSYVEVTVDEYLNEGFGSTLLRSYGIHECNEEDFDNDFKYKEYYKKSYCLLRKNETILMKSQDLWYGQYYFFAITLKICNNKTYNNSCKPTEEVLNYLKGKFFTFRFTESTFLLDDYESPEKKNYRNYYEVALDRNIFTRHFIPVMEVELTLDDFFLFSKPETKKFVQKGINTRSMEINYKTLEDFQQDNQIAQFVFDIDSCKRILKRKYQKITELLSLLGGLISLLHFLFSFLANYFLHKKNLMKFVNECYRITYNNTLKKEIKDDEVIKEENKKRLEFNVPQRQNFGALIRRNKEDSEIEMKNFEQKTIDFSIDKIRKNEEKTCMNEIVAKSKKISFFPHEVDEILDKKINSDQILFKISFWQYILYSVKSIFCKKRLNEKETMIEMCQKKYKKDLNIYNILRRIKEIDLLKKIVLDETQLYVFKNIPKPYLNINKTKKETKDIYQKNINFELLASKYFKNKIMERNMSTLDKSLLNYLKKN